MYNRFQENELNHQLLFTANSQHYKPNIAKYSQKEMDIKKSINNGKVLSLRIRFEIRLGLRERMIWRSVQLNYGTRLTE